MSSSVVADLGREVMTSKRLLFFDRVVRWTEEGVEYEADPRQVEKLLESLELDNANSVATPGQKCLPDQILAEVALEIAMQTPFRALGARANYLAADRPDVQFASKEICRWRQTLQT